MFVADAGRTPIDPNPTRAKDIDASEIPTALSFLFILIGMRPIFGGSLENGAFWGGFWSELPGQREV